MTRVAVSIISTNEMEKVASCLRSIAAQDFGGQIEVVVVCNGDPDDTARVRAIDPCASVIVNACRKGFAENHNLALSSSNADFVLMLNPDVELQPSCVRTLVEAMTMHVRAGMVGPLLRYPDGRQQPSARRFPRLMGTIVRRTPLRALMGARLRHTRHYLSDPLEDRAVDWLLGACLLVRMAAWREVDGFDPGFCPLYVEDIDLAWRLWSAGWEIWQVPAAEAIHEHQAATDKQFFDHRTLWHAHGMLRFVRKHPGMLWGRHPATHEFSRTR